MAHFLLIMQVLASIITIATTLLAICHFFYAKRNQVLWRDYIKKVGVWGVWGVVVLSGVLSLVIYWLPTKTDPTTFGFETEPTRWTARTRDDVKGVMAISQSAEHAKYGRQSLKVDVNLTVDPRDHAKGEVYVRIPETNLDREQISLWVFLPAQEDWDGRGQPSICGPSAAPNGLQIFVKSCARVKNADDALVDEWGGYYGKWHNIEPWMVGSWVEFTLTPTTNPAEEDLMTPSFDPQSIAEIGVLFGLNDQNTLTDYAGTFFLDAVDVPGIPATGGGARREFIRRVSIVGALVSVAVLALLGVWIWRLLAAYDRSTYGFETGTMHWRKRISDDLMGVTNVSQSHDQAKFGKCSLKVDVNLNVDPRDHAKGEVFVAIPETNLQGKQISACVFFPDAGILDPEDAPTGVQLFAKSCVRVMNREGKLVDQWGECYGTWNNIKPWMVEKWVEFTLTPSTTPSEANPFDPKRVTEVGVQIGLNDKNTSTDYRGSFFLDAVNVPGVELHRGDIQ